MNKSKLTICIVSHNQADLVSTLLESLEKNKPDFEFNVVILENVGDAPIVAFQQFDLNIDYQKNEIEEGLAENINKVFALAAGKSEYFCILNPDIVFKEEIITTLLSVMETNQIDIISPIVTNDAGKIQDSFRPLPTPVEIISRYLGLSKTEYRKESLPQIIYPDWVAAMFMLMKSSVFEILGGYNPAYKLYFEDVEFCTRARTSGYTIGVYRDTNIQHNAQRSSHKNLTYLIWHLSSALMFFTSKAYRKASKKAK